ncbi:hypothetical protein BDW62DRAFT_200060 [Aspergillus aurantiobrunneus]
MATKENSFHAERAGHGSEIPPSAWWEHGYLARLNIGIVCLTLLSSTNGYDSSLLNGLQALPGWLPFMEHPSSVWLGFINALY